MGGKLSSTKKRNERRFLMLGLDGGGKSTLLAQFRGNPIDPVEPTVKSQLHEVWSFSLRKYYGEFFVCLCERACVWSRFLLANGRYGFGIYQATIN